MAIVGDDAVNTDTDIPAFPPQSDMCGPILTLLEHGPRSSRELEDALAERFGITTRMRALLQGNGCPAWRNHLAWVLVNLGRHDRGTGQIERIQGRTAPDGGSMGIYRLARSNHTSQTPL